MHKATHTTQVTINSGFVSAAVDSEEGPSSTPWPSPGASSNLHYDEPFMSQSWPVASDLDRQYTSFGAAGEGAGPNDLDESFHSPDPFDSPSEIPSSPAAAFLSSLTPSFNPAPEGIPGYIMGATIGQGGFSTIKEAISPSGGTVAIKIVRRSAFASLPVAERAKRRSRLSHEARTWASLSHENILPLFDSYRSSEATYLVTLYCPAGSLLDILRREARPALEQSDAGCMFRQIVKALQYMHETVGLVHGDVKLDNVMVDESGVCRLADFGLARYIGSDSSQVSSASEDDADLADSNGKRRRAGTDGLPVHLSLLRHGPQRHRNSALPPQAPTIPPTHPNHKFLPGSLPYAAPELLLPYSQSSDDVNGHTGRPIANPAQDMWALGVLLYALLTGRLPFRDNFEPRLQMKILRGTYEMPSAIGQHAELVLKGCLHRDANERWTISQVDNAAWGIGYGDVRLDPALHEEQRTQSEERLLAPTLQEEGGAGVGARCGSPSAWSIASEPPPANTLQSSQTRLLLPSPFRAAHCQSGSGGSRSRSPSPSVAPCTPDDEHRMEEEEERGKEGYFGVRRCNGRGPREEGAVQIVVGGEGGAWGARDGVFDEKGGTGACAGVGVGAEGEALRNEDLGEKRQLGVRQSRHGAMQGHKGDDERRERSHSRTRSWTIDDLARRRLAL